MEKMLLDKLAKREAVGLLRELPGSLEGLVDFCSNDYLGYARLKVTEGAGVSGGATGSRLISGNSELAERLEEDIARFHGGEAALLFGSGYSANLGLLSAVVGRNDTIIYDKLLHASLRDGIVLSRAKAMGFAHNDAEDLQRKLAKANGRCLVVVESIYSMDGDVAPLKDITRICERAGAALIVDEAHSTGILGERGEGLVASLGLVEKVFARVHTFGKAMGSHGAAVVGSQVLKTYLLNFARPFIYSTALPQHTLYSIQGAYRQLAGGEALQRLRARIAFFRKNCPTKLRDQLVPSDSPIQALLCPGNAAVMELAASLRQARMAVLPIRYPTVPAGQERLRICLHTYNTEEEIKQLLEVLEQYY